MLIINDRLIIPIREFRFTFARSGGPGGQNVNKVNTKAVLRWNVAGSGSLPDAVRARFVKKYHRRINADGELVMSSERFRDQGRNVADCLAKLRTLIAAVAVAPRPRKKTMPSRAAVERRLKQKRETSGKKQRRRLPRDED